VRWGTRRVLRWFRRLPLVCPPKAGEMVSCHQNFPRTLSTPFDQFVFLRLRMFEVLRRRKTNWSNSMPQKNAVVARGTGNLRFPLDFTYHRWPHLFIFDDELFRYKIFPQPIKHPKIKGAIQNKITLNIICILLALERMACFIVISYAHAAQTEKEKTTIIHHLS